MLHVATRPVTILLVTTISLASVLSGCRRSESARSGTAENATTGEQSTNPPARQSAVPKEANGASGNKQSAASSDSTLPADIRECLAFSPPHAYAAFVARPSELHQKSSDANAALAPWFENWPYSPDKVAVVVGSVYPDGSLPALQAGFAVRLVQGESIVRRDAINWLNKRVEPSADGTMYYADTGPCIAFPDERTVVFGPYAFVASVLLPPPLAESNLVSQFRNNANCLVRVVADIERLQHYERHVRYGDPLARRLDHRLGRLAADFPRAEPRADSNDRTASLATFELPANLGRFRLNATASRGLPLVVSRVTDEWNRLLDGDFAESLTQLKNTVTSWAGGTEVNADDLMATLVDANELIAIANTSNEIEQLAVTPLAEVLKATARYRQSNGRLPQDITDEEGTPLLSWRVLLLPWLDEQALFGLFKLDEPWDSDRNRELLEQMPELYRSRGGSEGVGQSTLRMLRGGAFAPDGGARPKSQDGRAIALFEANAAAPWTRPSGVGKADDTAQWLATQLRASGSWCALTDGTIVRIPGSLHADQLNQLVDGTAPSSEDADPLNGLRASRLIPSLAKFDRLRETPLDDAGFDALIAAASNVDGLSDLCYRASWQDSPARAERAIRAALAHVDSSDADVRALSVRAIRMWDRRNAAWSRAALHKLAHDRYEAIRWIAAELIAETADPAVVQTLLLMPSQDTSFVQQLLRQSARLQAIAAEASADFLENQSSIPAGEFVCSPAEARMKAMQLIATFGDGQYRTLLERFTTDDDRLCRDVARQCLDSLTDKGPLAEAMEVHGDIRKALEEFAFQVATNDKGEIQLRLNEDLGYTRRLRDSDLQLLSQAGTITALDLSSTFVSTEGLKSIARLSQLRTLELRDCPRVADAGIRVVAELKGLESLSIVGTSITNTAIESLVEANASASLRSLDLSGTSVTDEVLVSLATLPQLDSLSLAGTQVTDKGMTYLEDHPRLRSLDISDTSIGDSGVSYLTTLKQLEYLDVRGTNVTAKGLAQLRAAFPGLELSASVR